MACRSHPSLSSQVSLVDLVRSDKTYKTIEEMIASTFDRDKVGKGSDASNLDHWGIKVIRIQEVKNGKLLQEYHYFRDELRKKTPDGKRIDVISDLPPKIWQFKKENRDVLLNEIYLFHGTSKYAAEKIIKDGFNIDTTDPNGLYGRGIYFAEEITKADQYSDDKEEREPSGTELTLLLCKVLMGNAFVCSKKNAKKWKQPPRPYDSVLGSGGMLFREFVIYDERQCYPEFLIKYERIGDWKPRPRYE